MAKHEDTWLVWATIYSVRFNLSIIPMLCKEDGSRCPGVPWKDFQTRKATISEILKWPREGIAVVTGKLSNVVVVDCESREDAAWFWDNRSKTPTVMQSRRGYHLWFKHPGEPIANDVRVPDEFGNARYDVRGDGGNATVPPTPHKNGFYRWQTPLIDTEKLPVFKPEWRPAKQYSKQSYDAPKYKDAVKYIYYITAVSGAGGHDNTFRAASVLRDAEIPEAEALLILQEWNKTNATPPWSDRDLLHKIRSAYLR